MQATKKSVHSHEWWFLGHNSFKGWSYLHANKIHLVFHARRLNKWAITHTFTHTRTSTNLPIFIYMFVVLNTCVALVYVHWKQHKKKTDRYIYGKHFLSSSLPVNGSKADYVSTESFKKIFGSRLHH